MLIQFNAIVALFGLIIAGSAHASNWHLIANDSGSGDRVEIDKARIAAVGPTQAMAWSRLTLGRASLPEDNQDAYSSVQALNRYDCEAKRFVTVKRVFLRTNHIVREENINSPKQLSAANGSVDERLLREACAHVRLAKEKGSGSKVSTGSSAASPLASGSADDSPPKAMYADMRSADSRKAPQLWAVSDTHPTARLESAAKSEPAAKTNAGKVAAPPPAAPQPPPPVIGALPIVATPHQAPPAKLQPATPGVQRAAPAALPSVLSITTAHPARRKATRTVRAKTSVPDHGETHAHWAYEGAGAPANWGKLRPDFVTCSIGKRQSPIDIKEGIRVDLEPINFNYKVTDFRIVDNGHTIQVNVGPGNSINIMNRQFELSQFHFHRPAEERINGRSYDMNMHFVHSDDQGRLAVVTVLLEKGMENTLIQTLWNNMPLEVDQEVVPNLTLDLNKLLPDNRAYYTYMGSLTTPPCTEGVLWMVLKQPIQASPEQISIFSRLYRNNARPIQAGNNRLVKETR